MYEPKYPPTLNESSVSLSNLRFGILHKAEYVNPDAPETDPLHIHNAVEIFWNVSSDVSFLVNNNLYRVPIGDAVVSRPNDVHMAVFQRATVHKYVCIWIDADWQSPVFSFLQAADFCPLFSFDEKTEKKLQELIFSLLTACDTGGSELEKVCDLLQILQLLKKSQPQQRTQGGIPAALQEILDDIHANPARIRSVNNLLQTHFVSSSTLTRWFRTYIHSSPREYLESVRLSNALTLLQSGASVTDACMRAGFSDCSHFISLFKKKFGETPFRYKKSRRQTPPS